MKDLVDIHYPEADKICVVLDNLNTHKLSSLYELYEPEEARRIVKKLEFHYTPVHGSWLNMAKIEISALSKQCTGRKIGNIDKLQQEITAWLELRNNQRIKVNWNFTTKKPELNYLVCIIKTNVVEH